MQGRIAFGLCCLAAAASLMPAAAVGGGALPPESLIFSAQALAVTAVIWTLLHRRCTTGSRGATVAAWTLASLATFWGFIAGFSIGFGLLLPAMLLLVATAWTPAPNVRDTHP